MAIFSCRFNVLSRANGDNAIQYATYCSGEKLFDERAGRTCKRPKENNVIASEILRPEGSAEWLQDRARLWNTVEQSEKRKDAQLMRECRVSLPIELSWQDNQALVRDFVRREFVSKGMVADIGYHDNPGNPHAHILLTMRQATKDGFAKRKSREWNDEQQLVDWRKAWAHAANKALEAAGSDKRIDHRTLKAQRAEALARGDMELARELDREPTVPRNVGQHMKQVWGWPALQLEQYENILKRNETRRKLQDNADLNEQIALQNSVSSYHRGKSV